MNHSNSSSHHSVLFVKTIVAIGAALIITGCQSAPPNPAPPDPALIKAGDDALKKRDAEMTAKAKHKP